MSMKKKNINMKRNFIYVVILGAVVFMPQVIKAQTAAFVMSSVGSMANTASSSTAINFKSTGISTPTTNASVTSQGPLFKIQTREVTETEYDEDLNYGIELNYGDRNYLELREYMYFLNHDDDDSNDHRNHIVIVNIIFIIFNIIINHHLWLGGTGALSRASGRGRDGDESELKSPSW